MIQPISMLQSNISFTGKHRYKMNGGNPDLKRLWDQGKLPEVKYGFYGVILLMLLMAASAFLDVFTAEPKVSEAYKERTVVNTPAPYDLHTYNPDRKIYKLWKEEK